MTRPSYQKVATDDEELNPPVQCKRTKGFLAHEVLLSFSLDAWLLLWSKAFRCFSYGFLSVVIVVYLGSLGLSSDQIGLMLTLTLFGDAILGVLLTTRADRWGRKKTLIVGSVVAIITSFIFASQRNFYVLLVAGILGVISPTGVEMGPFMAIEISSLAEVCLPSQMTSAMAWYNLFGSVSSALGALTCGILFEYCQSGWELDRSTAGSVIIRVYAAVQIGQLLLFSFLSNEIEAPSESNDPRSSNSGGFIGLHQSKWIVAQLSVLFMLDSFAGSFVQQSLIVVWFYDEYNTSSTKVGALLFYCNMVAGVSALFAAQIASYIGLLMTMVVTHLPSNVFFILVPLMPNELAAILMLCANFSISKMDVPTRNAYIQGVVGPDERSAANGVTNLAKAIAASFGPLISTILLSSPKTRSWPFFIAGGLKIVYDLLLLHSFRSVKSKSDIHDRHDCHDRRSDDVDSLDSSSDAVEMQSIEHQRTK